MSIIQTVEFCDFQDAFHRMNRADAFTYEGKRVLFDYIEECSEGGEPIELDVIALCCEYQESDAASIASEYDDAPQLADSDGDEDAHAEAVEAWLQEKTSVCGKTSNGGFVFAQF